MGLPSQTWVQDVIFSPSIFFNFHGYILIKWILPPYNCQNQNAFLKILLLSLHSSGSSGINHDDSCLIPLALGSRPVFLFIRYAPLSQSFNFLWCHSSKYVSPLSSQSMTFFGIVSIKFQEVHCANDINKVHSTKLFRVQIGSVRSLFIIQGSLSGSIDKCE